MLAILYRLVKREEGVTAIEYGLIAALIAVVIIAGLVVLGPRIRDLFLFIADQMP